MVLPAGWVMGTAGSGNGGAEEERVSKVRVGFYSRCAPELHGAETGCLEGWGRGFLLLRQNVENARFLRGAWAWLVLRAPQGLSWG